MEGLIKNTKNGIVECLILQITYFVKLYQFIITLEVYTYYTKQQTSFICQTNIIKIN